MSWGVVSVSVLIGVLIGVLAVLLVLRRPVRAVLPGLKFLAYIDVVKESTRREEQVRMARIIRDLRVSGTAPWMVVRDLLLAELGFEGE